MNDKSGDEILICKTFGENEENFSYSWFFRDSVEDQILVAKSMMENELNIYPQFYKKKYCFMFQEFYTPLHGYLSILVCIFGTFFNFLNILVLSHKDMRDNPINLILTGISVADILISPFSSSFTLKSAHTNCHDPRTACLYYYWKFPNILHWKHFVI